MQIFDAAMAGNIRDRREDGPGRKPKEPQPLRFTDGLLRLAIVAALVGILAIGLGRAGGGHEADRTAVDACGYGDVRTCID